MLKEFDVSAIRQDFPILNQEIHKKPLIYLDSAASAQKPRPVITAMDNYYLHDHSNVHRGAHTLGDRATSDFESAREAVRAFINADSKKEIIWTRGTTEALNLVASTHGESLKPGDEIVVSRMEHHANIVPWQIAAEKSGASLKVLELDERGCILEQDIETRISERCRIVAVAHASNVLGTINPVEKIIQRAKQVGATTVIDGAQAVPHFQVDVQALDCDFYAFSSHKLLGPTGIGVLYGKQEKLNALPPYQGGGEMIKHVSFEKTTYNELPYKFEAGTPAICEAVGLHAALDYFNQLDRVALETHEQTLLQRAMDQVRNVPGMRVIGTADQKVPVMSFLVEGLHPSDLGTLLDQQGIAIRTGHHCAMPLMEKLEIPGTARASFAFYNTLEEVDKLMQGLQRIQSRFV